MSFMDVSRESEPRRLKRCVLRPKAMAQEKPLTEILVPSNATTH